MSGSTPRTIIVTGASGFVGACLCRYFAARGDRVVAVHGPSRQRWRLDGAPSSIEHVQVDLGSADEVTSLVDSVQPTAILNCAAYGAYPSQVDPERVYRVNFEAVRHLLRAASKSAGFRAFVQAGSSSEYGLRCAGPSEESATHPDSDYAVSKVAATAYVQYSAAKQGIPAWVLRLYSVYGPYEDASRLVPRLLSRAQEGGYPVLANPHISRDFVFIDDVCEAFERVLERAGAIESGGIFNIGTGRRTTLEEIVGQVRELYGIEAEPQWGSMADRRWDHRDWYSNPAKAADVLGWQARTSLAQGLGATAAWMKAHPERFAAAEQHRVTGAS